MFSITNASTTNTLTEDFPDYSISFYELFYIPEEEEVYYTLPRISDQFSEYIKSLAQSLPTTTTLTPVDSPSFSQNLFSPSPRPLQVIYFPNNTNSTQHQPSNPRPGPSGTSRPNSFSGSSSCPRPPPRPPTPPPFMALAPMAYTPWTIRVKVAVEHNWVTLRQFKRVMTDVSGINWGVATSRSQALESLNRLVGDAPFARAQRFPDDVIYVNLDYGDWPKKLAQLKTSLSFKCGPGGTRTTTNQSEGDKEDENNSRLAFYQGVANVNQQLANGNCVFDQTSFETEYGLTWA